MGEEPWKSNKLHFDRQFNAWLIQNGSIHMTPRYIQLCQNILLWKNNVSSLKKLDFRHVSKLIQKRVMFKEKEDWRIKELIYEHADQRHF